jgi:hypothetical protein
MRLTIIPSDRSVYIDNVVYTNLDLSYCSVPNNVHAFQWYDTYGELEFKRSFVDGQVIHPENKIVLELPDWVNACIAKWNEAKSFEEEQRILAEQAAASLLAQQEANKLGAVE